MDRENIVEQVIDLLRQHVNGQRGSILEEPYKGDLFELFATAFNAGLIENSGELSCLGAAALADVIESRVPDLMEHETWPTMLVFWREWTYAWRLSDQIL
jgi:hypothetical protein